MEERAYWVIWSNVNNDEIHRHETDAYNFMDALNRATNWQANYGDLAKWQAIRDQATSVTVERI